MEIVKFKNGQYGVRQTVDSYMELGKVRHRYEWLCFSRLILIANLDRRWNHCEGTLEEARQALDKYTSIINKMNDDGEPVDVPL